MRGMHFPRFKAAAGASWLTALLAGALVVPPPALATIPREVTGTWAISETRGGQRCTATLMLQPTRLAQSAADLERGAARYQGVCVDSASGSWQIQVG